MMMTRRHFFTSALTAIIVFGFTFCGADAGVHRVYRDGERITFQETAIPEAAGDYYRTPGAFIASAAEHCWFGPEVDSRVLCDTTTHRFNNVGFFDIVYTREEARVWPSAMPGRVWWYRKQEWRFATADTPWGTDTVYITLVSEIKWADIDSEDTITGFPWSGFEEHWREGDTVKSKADIIGYYPYELGDERYIAPKYAKSGTFEYRCETGSERFDLKIVRHTEGGFASPRVRPGSDRLSRRAKRTGDWYDCIRLK